MEEKLVFKNNKSEWFTISEFVENILGVEDVCMYFLKERDWCEDLMDAATIIQMADGKDNIDFWFKDAIGLSYTKNPSELLLEIFEGFHETWNPSPFPINFSVEMNEKNQNQFRLVNKRLD